MKRFFTVFCLLILIGVSSFATFELEVCASEKDYNNAVIDTINSIEMYIGKPQMRVNREVVNIDDSGITSPIIKDGRTLVPIRAIVESMGGAVDWDGKTNTVTIYYKNNTMNLKIDVKTASLNGETKSLDVAPTIINGRTMLPIRFVAENLGCEVFWVGEENKIIIAYSSHNLQIDYSYVEKDKIVIGMDLTYRPFEYYEDGVLKGFDIELIEKLSNDLQFDYVIVNVDYLALFPLMERNTFDLAISALTATKEREESCDFTIPYVEYTVWDGANKYDEKHSIAISNGMNITEELNNTIQIYKANGTIDNLMKKWHLQK